MTQRYRNRRRHLLSGTLELIRRRARQTPARNTFRQFLLQHLGLSRLPLIRDQVKTNSDLPKSGNLGGGFGSISARELE